MWNGHVRIFLATSPVDMRIGFDRIAGIIRERIGDDPRSGSLFVFVNQRADRCKVYFHDRTGTCVLSKRLDRGVFVRAPVTEDTGACRIEIDHEKLARWLEGVADESDKRVQSRGPKIH